MIRHGDVVILKCSEDRTEESGLKVNTLITAKGETTGHHHELMPFEGAECEVLDADEDLLSNGIYDGDELSEIFFNVKGSSVIQHEEHNPIIREKGTYKAVIQQSYNPFMKAVEKVAD